MANHLSPPWHPDMDREAEEFYRKLSSEKYGGHVDALGDVRWSSEWRMHRGNGLNPLDATVLVFKAIDAIRSGRQPDPSPPGPFDVPWTPDMDAEVPGFRSKLEALYQQHQGRPVDPTGIVRWSSDYRIARANGLGAAAAWSKIERDILREWKVSVPKGKTRRPLIGPLRIQNKLFADDTGFRRILFCSWFPTLRILRDNPAEFERQMDVIADAGYQGFRTFFSVGGWSTYWDGREVAPVTFQKWLHSEASGLHRPASLGKVIEAWPDYDELLRTMLRGAIARGLRIHQSVGDHQIIFPGAESKPAELEFNRRVARICAEEGGLDVMALVGDTNEYPQNRYGAESPESIEQMGKIIRIWEEEIPGVHTTMGARISEEPDDLFESITHGDVCTVHPSRGVPPISLKRTHALTHWEGNYRFFPKPFWEGESMGWGKEVSVDRFTRNADGYALYTLHALLGHASVFFNGPAIHSREPLESVGPFYELPKFLEEICPEDVATWDNSNNGRGGIAYWHREKRFITVSHEDWDPSPPRAIGSWTIYNGDTVRTGSGTPPRFAGVLTGEFK